jgi:hypothetical protein
MQLGDFKVIHPKNKSVKDNLARKSKSEAGWHEMVKEVSSSFNRRKAFHI